MFLLLLHSAVHTMDQVQESLIPAKKNWTARIIFGAYCVSILFLAL